MSENRQFPRLKNNAKVKWRVSSTPDSPVQLDDGLQINISGGGICFASQLSAPVGTMIALELDLPSYPTALLALARVRWVDPVESGGFEIGAEFHWIGWDSNFAQQQIANFVKSKLE
jgi:hypothetical protein